MRDALPVIGAIACCAALSACTTAGAKHAPGDGSVHQLHQAFISAINTNNADAILALCTEDVVFLPPNEPAVVGKAAARQWLDAYLNTYTTRQE